MDQDVVVGCTASLRSLATYLFKALLFPNESPWIVQHQPDYQECLASKHSCIDIAPWKLVRGPSDALAELKGFVDIQEKIGLKFSEVAEGYATLTSFAAEVTARGLASDCNHFYLVLLGSMIMTTFKVRELEVRLHYHSRRRQMHSSHSCSLTYTHTQSVRHHRWMAYGLR
jgi:hypothetical protein